MAHAQEESMWTHAHCTLLQVTGRRDVCWSAGGCLSHAEPPRGVITWCHALSWHGCGECGHRPSARARLPCLFLLCRGSFRILPLMTRIVPVAAICSFLFPQKQEEWRGGIFLRVLLPATAYKKHTFSLLPSALSYRYVASVCLLTTLILWFSSFSLKETVTLVTCSHVK